MVGLGHQGRVLDIDWEAGGRDKYRQMKNCNLKQSSPILKLLQFRCLENRVHKKVNHSVQLETINNWTQKSAASTVGPQTSFGRWPTQPWKRWRLLSGWLPTHSSLGLEIEPRSPLSISPKPVHRANQDTKPDVRSQSIFKIQKHKRNQKVTGNHLLPNDDWQSLSHNIYWVFLFQVPSSTTNGTRCQSNAEALLQQELKSSSNDLGWIVLQSFQANPPIHENL